MARAHCLDGGGVGPGVDIDTVEHVSAVDGMDGDEMPTSTGRGIRMVKCPSCPLARVDRKRRCFFVVSLRLP